MLARPVTHVARPVLLSAAINAGEPSVARAADTVSEQVANSLKRFAVSSWMPLKYDADGALHLYFQNARLSADEEATWQPASKGPLSLTLRLSAPKSVALTGKWNPPPVMKAATRTLLPAR